MSRKLTRAEVLAITPETGPRVGHGQDNMVFGLELPDYAEKMRATGDWVLKVSHRSMAAQHKRNWDVDPKEAAQTGTIYKKNKYEILKHFLGDYVPKSMFLTSTVRQNGVARPAEITLQRRVPNVTLNNLTEAQKDDPRLHANILGLLQRLQYMYSVVGEANARSSQGAALDTKLDLGPISDFVRSYSLDHQFSEGDAAVTAHKIKSPNLLVDPDTLNLYAIDFDQGDWSPGMNEAKALVFDIDERRRARASELSHLAMQGVIPSAPPNSAA